MGRRFGRGVPGVALTVAVLTGVGGAGATAHLPSAGAEPTHIVTSRVAALVSEPVRLRIPVLGVDAAVASVVTGSDGELGVPDDPAVVGWWQAGGAPGAPGAAGVLDGHVDSAVAGPGALFGVAALRAGDSVTVLGRDGTSRSFAVRTVHRYAKTALPPAVFMAGRGPQLVLVTCGGHFDHRTRQYADNVVVVADPQF